MNPLLLCPKQFSLLPLITSLSHGFFVPTYLQCSHIQHSLNFFYVDFSLYSPILGPCCLFFGFYYVSLMLYAYVNFWIKLQIWATNFQKSNTKMYTSIILLTKPMFKCLQHASQACKKTCLILRAK